MRLSISPARGTPFLCQPDFTRNEWWVVGQIIQECKATCTNIHPFSLRVFLFTSHLPFPIPLPPFLLMPSSVLRIHLKIKHIYHSATDAGKGGSVWNALALREGKGAMLPCMLPAVPFLAFSVSLHVFLFHATALQISCPFLS